MDRALAILLAHVVAAASEQWLDRLRYIFDSLPLIALIAAWWIGGLGSLRLLRGQHLFPDVILFSAFLAYGLLGVYIGGRVQRIMSICLDQKLFRVKRYVVALACIALMSISFL